MTRLLSLVGLMRVREHERIIAENDDRAYDSWIKMINERDFYVDEYKVLEAKYKQAVADLEKQAGEIARLTNGWERSEKDKSLLRRQLDESEAELADLRPDALAMRRKRQRDRKRMAGKRNG